VVVVCNEDVNLWFITSTEDSGAFELAELPPNEFSVEVNSPLWRRPNTTQVWGYRPWTGAIMLHRDQNLQRTINLGNVSNKQQLAPKTPPPCSPSRSFSMAGRLETLLVEQTTPVYPQGAEVDGEAQVVLEAFMNREGKVISLRLLPPSWPPKVNSLLTRSAVEAVRNWRYRRPEKGNGPDDVFEFLGQIVVDFSRDR
jgi:TonB family protein